MESNRKIYTVSKLNNEIKFLLEDSFPFIWVSGEISNFSSPVSGHYYFTLKDPYSMISSVMFKGQNKNLKFMPENGMMITGFGRVSLYEPRGTYQIIFEFIEPKGAGSLQVAFEQLKKKLETEGLFNKEFKKPIPYIPERIVLITSPTGSVVHDIINIVSRRFGNVIIDIVKVKVQGDGAEDEIEKALKFADETQPDVIIIARGGGSFEDLAPFNSEKVARAVFETRTPVISAVGHETDFTITDFVADVRAETPSAAAELVVPSKKELEEYLKKLSSKLALSLERAVEKMRDKYDSLFKRLKSPERKLVDQRLRIDELSIRVARSYSKKVLENREKLKNLNRALFSNSPVNNIINERKKLEFERSKILSEINNITSGKRNDLEKLKAKLEGLNPLAVLERGYSITRLLPAKRIVGSVDAVKEGNRVEIIVNDGIINCLVEGKTDG